MTTLATLRANALSPALYSDRVPDGVLRDVGLSAWEMPAGHGRGYMNYLRALDGAVLDAFLLEPVRSNPAFVNRAHLEEFRANIDAHGTLLIPELSTIYGRGTSLCLQNCVFSPSRTALGVNSFHDFAPGVDAVLDEWSGKRLYLNVGMANGAEFLTGELRFNLAHPLECRPAVNLRRLYVDAAAFSVAASHYIHETSQFCSDMVPRPHLHPVFDPTHPDVVALCLDSITDLATSLGAAVRYVVHGESSMVIPLLGSDQTKCGAELPLTTDCQNCEPVTPYSAAVVAGFRVYLEAVLGLSIGQVNERWNTDYADFTEIDPATIAFCPGNPEGLKEWRRYLTFLILELGIVELSAAKTAAPTAECGVLRFAARGAELSWLAGDFAALGDWQNHTYDSYRAAAEFDLEVTADAARLSGVPPAFPISSAVHDLVDPVEPQDNPKVFRAWWRYRDDGLDSFFRDLLTAGCAHHSYLRAPGNAIVEHAESLEAVMSAIEDVAAQHPTHLAMCGAWQRVAIHVEDLEQLKHPKQPGGGPRVAWHLRRLLRGQHVPVALFSEPRVRTRTLARWWLSRSLVVVPYHTQLEEIQEDYADLFPAGAPGAALFVAKSLTGAVPEWVDQTPLVETPVGPLHRCVDGLGDQTNCFYLAARAPACSLDATWSIIAGTIDSTVRPLIESYIAASGGAPFTAAPVTITGPSPVVANHVTDGLNFLVAVSNMATAGTATVTVGVAPAVAAALGVTYPQQVVSLAAGQGARVLLEAVPVGIDVAAAIADANSKLDTLEGLGAYDTAAGRDCLTRASALLPAHPGRALAAYTAAVRMVYLQTAVDPGLVTVSARRIGIVGEAATAPVAGCRVQLLFPLNGREEQEDEGVTDGSGVAGVAVSAPASPRWDFATGTWGAPPAGAGDLVEVHVTDPVWGSSTRRIVDVS